MTKSIIFQLNIIIVLLTLESAACQEKLDFSNQNTQLDTARLLSDTPIKSPWGAVLRSAVIPGWGQVYNKQYLKAGLALSLNTLMVYQIFWYQHKWEDTGKRRFQDKRNLYTWYFSLTYLLTMVDAYVDAYLFKFDEAMKVGHRVDIREGRWIAEIYISFQF